MTLIPAAVEPPPERDAALEREMLEWLLSLPVDQNEEEKEAAEWNASVATTTT